MEGLKARVSSLFDAIKHGDDEHEKWLRKAIVDHFAGREVERPKGSGNREIIEQQQARIAGLEADLATQIQIGVTDAEEMDRLAERAEAAESALAQAKAREAELVGAIIKASECNREIPDDWKGIDAQSAWEAGHGFGVLDAVTVMKEPLAATTDRIKAAAEVLALLNDGFDPEVSTRFNEAVERYREASRLDQPESG